MSKPQDPATAAGDAPEGTSSSNAATKPRWKRLLGKSWVILFVIVLIVLQFGLFSYLRHGMSAIPTTPEITLGEFQFENTAGASSVIQAAKFELHMGLLPEVDRDARLRLVARRCKVQQGIEELLRRAHATDFEDPALTELKRRLQEQINTSLGLRAVSEVIITDLALTRNTAQAGAEQGKAVAPADTFEHAAPTAAATPADASTSAL